MGLILGIIILYIGVSVLIGAFKDIDKLRPYLGFKIRYPSSINRSAFFKHIERLTEFDPPTMIPDEKKLEFIIARMRNINFPEGVTVEYKGKKLTV